MADDASLTVFLSSRVTGYESLRDVADEAIRQVAADENMQISVVRCEVFPGSPKSPQTACREEVTKCDLYLGILGADYSKPVDDEYEVAKSVGIPRLILVEDQTRDRRQAAFIRRISDYADGNYIRSFSDKSSLRHEVYRAIREYACPMLGPYFNSLVESFHRLPRFPGDLACPTVDDVEVASLVEWRRIQQGEERENDVRFTIRVEEALKRDSGVVVVGPAGSGKTTLLRSLVYRYAKALGGRSETRQETVTSREIPIPIYIDGALCEGSLLSEIVRSFQHRGVPLGASHCTRLLRRKRVLLLLDGLDRARQKKALLRDLDELRSSAAHLLFIIAGRKGPEPHLSHLPEYKIEALTDRGVTQVLSGSIDAAQAESICRTLSEYGLLDAFRQPLLARFLGMSLKSGTDRLVRGSLLFGVIYRTVFEDSLLRRWERDRDEGSPKWDPDEVMLFLSAVGYHMCSRDIETVDSATLRTVYHSLQREDAWSGDEEILIQLCTDLGLLAAGIGEQIQFGHPSFRDYFAASCVARKRLSVERIALRAIRSAAWRPTALFLAGLLDRRRSDRFLRYLVLRARWSLWSLRLSESAEEADFLFFVLRVMASLRERDETTIDTFVERIVPSRVFFWGRACVDQPSLYFKEDYEQVEEMFWLLLCAIGTSRCVERLTAPAGSSGWQYKLPGIARRAAPDTLERIVSTFSRPNGYVADYIAAHMVLQHDPNQVISVMEQDSNAYGEAAVARMFRGMGCVLSGSHGPLVGAAPFTVSPSYKNAWIDFACKAALHAEDSNLAAEAMHVLRKLEDHTHIPERAERIFMDALDADDELVQYQAAHNLWAGTLGGSREKLIRGIETMPAMGAFGCIEALRFRDRGRFPVHLTSLLKRGCVEVREVPLDYSSVIEGISERVRTESVSEADAELMFWQVAGFGFAWHRFVRSWIIEAIRLIRSPLMEPLLAYALKHEEADLRREAIMTLLVILDVEASPYVEIASRDAAVGVRNGVLWYFCARHASSECFDRAWPWIERMLGDSDHLVRSAAAHAVANYREPDQAVSV